MRYFRNILLLLISGLFMSKRKILEWSQFLFISAKIFEIFTLSAVVEHTRKQFSTRVR